MAAEAEQKVEKNLQEARVIINYDEPPRRPPPIASVGPVGWMRTNLFGSVFDTVLTIFASILIVISVISFSNWSISDAGWQVINQNFRFFMAGTYPLDATWRLNIIYYFVAFLVGFSIATYSSATRLTWTIIGIGIAILFVVPVIVSATFPVPRGYLSAGEIEVQSGTVTESPTATRAFTARAGAQIRISLAESLATNEDTDMLELAGFMDRPTAAVFNAAANRLEGLARMDEIERILAADGRLEESYLTRTQRGQLTDELEDLQGDDLDPVLERYNVNNSAVNVRLLNAEGILVAEQDLSIGGEPLAFSVTQSGWYILETSVEASQALAILETVNVYPLISRVVSVDLLDEDGEPLIDEDTGRVQTGSVEQFVNVYTHTVTDDPRPELDGEEIPLMRLIDNQYRGERKFSDYMTFNVAPVFSIMQMSILGFAAMLFVGYSASNAVRSATPRVPGGGFVNVINMGGWLLFVFLLFTLTIGIDDLNPITLGNLAGLVMVVGIMFFLGANISRLQSTFRPLFGLGLVMIFGHLVVARLLLDPRPALAFTDSGIEGWAISAGFIAELALWIVIGISALRSGIQNENKLSASANMRGLIGAFVLWIAVLVLSPIVINGLASVGVITNYRTADLLPVSRFNLWGGFFLTFMLTVVGIVASFPIGVLLALGRRAHRYPVIKYVCILLIEFVRGVPLITVLFMASLLVPLLNPALATIPQVIRAMIGITIFSAAYLAENVRGGLQSIPSGQEEAGKAVGLNNVQITMLIMLPQALRAVIPALVGQAIALFKDTSLVFIVGLAELTGVASRVVAQAEFIGLRLESFIFISVIYFIFSYVMSFVSRRIEESGSGSARR